MDIPDFLPSMLKRDTSWDMGNCSVMGEITLKIVFNKHKRDRKFVPVNVRFFIFYFICDQRKIKFPPVALATRENKLSMLTRDIKNLTLAGTNIL